MGSLAPQKNKKKFASWWFGKKSKIQNCGGGHLEKRPVAKNPGNFERYPGAIFFLKGPKWWKKLSNLISQKMVTEFEFMTWLVCSFLFSSFILTLILLIRRIYICRVNYPYHLIYIYLYHIYFPEWLRYDFQIPAWVGIVTIRTSKRHCRRSTQLFGQ